MGNSRDIWDELAPLTQWFIIIGTIILFFGSPIGVVIGSIIGYFWLAPWTANLAKEHNRSINWAYSFGFFFSFLGCGIWWIYVKLTTDPIER